MELENNAGFFRFEDLRIYAKALEYAVWLHQTMAFTAGGFAPSYRASFLRSANALALPTAEGSSRHNSQFL